jgi:hypothetical protein
MAQPGPSQLPPSSSATVLRSVQKPVVAVGRKVKSVLTTQQRPSVRILREPSSTREPRRVPVSKSIAKGNGIASRFADARNHTGAAIRSLLSPVEHFTDDESFENEYDPDTVDLMDVVGMYNQRSLKASKLTLCRPRSSYTFYPHQCSKFALRPLTWKISQSSTYV